MLSRTHLQRTPEGYAYPIGRVLSIYSALMVIMFLASLDQTIVATALPHIVRDIGGIENYSWVFGSYLLFQTISVPIYGKLGDVHGSRAMLLFATAIFLLGSTLCGIAQSMTELVACRAVQGIGAGGLVPLIHATIGEMIPPRERGRYQGLISAAYASASVLGPAVGGVIVDHTTWRWIFFVNVPPGCVALVAAWFILPRLRQIRPHKVDYVGGSLLASGTAALLVALTWGGVTYPWLSANVLGAIAISFVALTGFVLQERRASETILPFATLRVPTVLAGAASMGIAATCMFGTIAFVPLFAQGVIGMTAVGSGVVLTPLMIGAAATSVVSGWWVSRSGHYRSNLIAGSIVLGAGMALLSRLDTSTTVAMAARDMFVVGVGIGLMMSVFITAVQNAVPLSDLGATTGFLQFARILGATLGVTIFGTIIDRGLPNPGAGLRALHGGAPLARRDLATAMPPAFLFASGTCLVLLLIVLVGMKQHPLRRSVADYPTDTGMAA